jgi:hypothetical protein
MYVKEVDTMKINNLWTMVSLKMSLGFPEELLDRKVAAPV